MSNKNGASAFRFEGLTPDTEIWRKIIPFVHPNRYIREYSRSRYILEPEYFIQDQSVPENGLFPEKGGA